jgi:hypothetical protein
MSLTHELKNYLSNFQLKCCMGIKMQNNISRKELSRAICLLILKIDVASQSKVGFGWRSFLTQRASLLLTGATTNSFRAPLSRAKLGHIPKNGDTYHFFKGLEQNSIL